MSRRPLVWCFSDAPYCGGAEHYLQWHMEAAGPDGMGLIAVDSPGLKAWINAREGNGFHVERVAVASLRAKWWALYKLLRRIRPQVLHINMPAPYEALMAAAPAIARAAGVPRVVVTEHLPGEGRVGKRYWFKRAWVPCIDRAITVCESHQTIMREVFGYREKQLVAIPNGVRDPRTRGDGNERGSLPEDLASTLPDRALRVVQLGSLDLRKGGDLLIDAFAGVLERRGDVVLLMVGEGRDRGVLEARVHEHGLEKSARLTGHRQDAQAILRAADVVVLASRMEGMPLSLLEAMAHARALIATAVDGVGEIVLHEQTGLLVPPEDVAALRGALLRLLEDEALRVELGARARARYEERHRLEAMVGQTFAQYGVPLNLDELFGERT